MNFLAARFLWVAFGGVTRKPHINNDCLHYVQLTLCWVSSENFFFHFSSNYVQIQWLHIVIKYIRAEARER